MTGQNRMELRQQWRKQGEEENWTFLFYHDIAYPTFQFSKQKKACPKKSWPLLTYEKHLSYKIGNKF